MKMTMKKTIILAGLAIVALLASCSKIETPEEETAESFSPDDVQLCITVPEFNGDADTKAAKSGWVSGDKIYINFDGNSYSTNSTTIECDLIIEYDGSTWKCSAWRQGVTLSSSGSFTALYSSTSLTTDNYAFYNSNPKKLYPKTLSLNIGDAKIQGLIAYCEYPVSYSFSNKTLKANLSGWKFATDVQVKISEGIYRNHEYYLACDALAILNNVCLENNKMNYYLSGRNHFVKASNEGRYKVFNFVCDSGGEHTFTFELYDATDDITYTYTTGKKSLNNTNTTLKTINILFTKFTRVKNKENGHAYVDMGTSVNGKKILWADMDIEATNEEDEGSLFAWAERSTKSTYTWSNYYYSDGSSTTSPNMRKYVLDSYYGNVDNMSVLDANDDMASYSWGGSWRTPTLDDIQALINNCTWKWQSSKIGWLVTASNGNTIFLPGQRNYWTATLSSNNSRRAKAFGEDGEGNVYIFEADRYHGYKIRPVFTRE